jgi:hypothetical protein
MKNKFKLGQILCDKSTLKKSANQRSYYVVVQEEGNDKYLVIQPINSNSDFECGTSIYPSNPDESLIETELKASYLLHQEISIVDYKLKKFVFADATGFEGNDRVVKFTPINDYLIGNIYYELKTEKKITVSGFLFCEFYCKEKFIKPPFQN